MNKQQFNQQQLIDDFPYDARSGNVKRLWQKQKKEESLTLFVVMVCLSLTGVPIILLILVYWPQGWDTNPLTGIIILAVVCSLFFFRSKMGMVWEWIVKKW